MASLNVVDKKGKEKEKIKISDNLVKQDSSQEVIYQDVRRYLARVRSGTHSTKSRSEVRGGGRKPWRQKGTGNARAGTIRSPIWKGGGVAFGPKPRDYSFKLNKKVKQLARKSALTYKAKSKSIKVLEDFSLETSKTKEFITILNKLEINDNG